MEWPSGSPDLNPIKHVWDVLGRTIRQVRIPPQNLQKLGAMLVQLWRLIPKAVFGRIIQSMRRRCVAVVNAHGGHTRYWHAFIKL